MFFLRKHERCTEFHKRKKDLQTNVFFSMSEVFNKIIFNKKYLANID